MKFDSAVVKAWVAGVLAGIYEPEPDEEIWEWAERTLRIPATENEEQANQYWSASYSPYVKELFEWFKKPGKAEFWIQKSSQVGFTMACLILICWMVVHRQGNMIYAIDSEKQAREVSKTRLQKWIKNNKLLEEVGEDPDDITNLTYFLKGLTVYMVGSHAAGSWATKSCVLVILDEVDKQPYIEGEGWTTDLARDRVKRPKNAKIIGFSTPGESGQIGKEVGKGTCEEIRVPFPCCGHKQALKWGNMVFGTAEFLDLAGDYDLEKVRENTYFKCEFCADGRLSPADKFDALQKYEFVATNPKPTPNVRSLKIWDAYSMFLDWGDIAVKWITAQGDPTKLQKVMQGERGEYFTFSTGDISRNHLLDLCGAYKRGECPIVPLFISLQVDLQKGCYKAVKTAFNERGDMYVIDWDTLVSWEEVVEFADMPVPCSDGQDRVVLSGLVDEGNGDGDTIPVREFCLAHYPRFFPVKGRGRTQINTTIALSEGWLAGELVETYHINDFDFKMQLRHRILKSKANETKLGIRKLIFPMDVDEDEKFLEEFTSEKLITKKNKLGREFKEWEVKGQNDFWDCCKYGLAIYMIKVGFQHSAGKDEDENSAA